MKTNKSKTRKIRPVMEKVIRFLMHRQPHLDEILARLIIVLYGLELFPGADTAATDFVEEDPVGTNKSFDKSGDVLLGVGLLQRFNEHLEDGRMKGECTTTLVVKFLQKVLRTEIAEIKKLVATTLRYDTGPGCPESHLAEILKAMNRVYPKDSGYVLQVGTLFLEAVITCERLKLAAVKDEGSLKDLFDGWKKRKGTKGVDKNAVARIERMVTNSMKHSDEVADLSHIVTALYRRQCYTGKEIVQYVDDVFDTLYTDQSLFNQAVEEIGKYQPILIQATLHKKNKTYDCELKLVVCYGDAPQTHKAALYLGADIVLQENNSGNVQIFTNRKVKGLSLANTTKMIRFLELSPKGKERATWKNLSTPGLYPGLKDWYYFREGQMLFNGSLTREATPTRIGLKVIIEILQYSFHWDGVRHWCLERGINIHNLSGGTVLPKGRLTGRRNHMRRHDRRGNQPQRKAPQVQRLPNSPLKVVKAAFDEAEKLKKGKKKVNPKKLKRETAKAARKDGPKDSRKREKGSPKREERKKSPRALKA